MIAPVKRLLKRELEWLGTHRCRHGHTFLEHYDCFLSEKPETCPFDERVGFLDIETSNLDADFGYVFSWGIKDRGGEISGRVLTPHEIKSHKFDKKLIAELCTEIKKYHRIVAHWGLDRRFDLPFLRTRAVFHGLDFPLYKDIYVEDTWYIAKNKLKLHSNRLEAICDFFGIPSKDHKMKPRIWQKALSGDKDSLEYIWTHNVEDVISLEAVWELLHQFTPRGKRSI